LNAALDRVTINGVTYVREDIAPAAKPLPGKRAIVVCDRGWIFCGDVTESAGRILLSRAVHVRSWEGIGFDGMVSSGGKGRVTVKPVSDVDFPSGSELFRVPVPDAWGMP
jgi:hypothetical protein